MLSDTKCKQILNKNGIHYSDEEIVILKAVLYKLAELTYRSDRRKLSKKVVSEMKQTNT